MKIVADNEIKILTDKIILNVDKDYMNKYDSTLIYYLLEKDDIVLNKSADSSFTITKNTAIISFPRYIDKIVYLYNNYKLNSFIQESLLPSEYFIYIRNLGLIIAKEGAHHRLAAIHKFVNGDNKVCIDNKYFSFRKISLDKLEGLLLNKYNSTIYYLDEYGFKHIKQVEIDTFSFIESLQKKYLNRVNKLTFINFLKFKFYYKRNPLDKIADKLKYI